MKNAKVKVNKQSFSTNNFSELLSDPPIAMSLFLIALVALLLAVLEFSRAIH